MIMSRNKHFPNHRYNGWPGAMCYYCCADDPRELCRADGHIDDCYLPQCQEQPCPATEQQKRTIDELLDQ